MSTGQQVEAQKAEAPKMLRLGHWRCPQSLGYGRGHSQASRSLGKLYQRHQQGPWCGRKGIFNEFLEANELLLAAIFTILVQERRLKLKTK